MDDDIGASAKFERSPTLETALVVGLVANRPKP